MNPKIEQEIASAIDTYLIAAFDFELPEYVDETSAEFNNLMHVCRKIKVKDSNLYSSFLDFLQEFTRITQEISLSARKLMEKSHWITLVLLASSAIFLLYSMRETTLASSILTVLLSSATALVLFLLYDIDNRTFAEEKLAFHVFQQVFKEIGRLPYYPDCSAISGRVKFPKGPHRLGVYKNYPKSYEKEIKIVGG